MDYTQCAASARDLSNAITRHKPRATYIGFKHLCETPELTNSQLSFLI